MLTRLGLSLDEFVRAASEDWQAMPLEPLDRALCAFAIKLTETPGAMLKADIAVLREHGLDDIAIHDAIQVIAYFNYINRVADAVHVDLEADMPPYPMG
ncbi:MAG: putative peroxidase-related enzyme [Planctomycetota bacterium]